MRARNSLQAARAKAQRPSGTDALVRSSGIAGWRGSAPPACTNDRKIIWLVLEIGHSCRAKIEKVIRLGTFDNYVSGFEVSPNNALIVDISEHDKNLPYKQDYNVPNQTAPLA